MSLTDRELRIKSILYRKKLLTCIEKAGTGHTGGSLSCVDILNVLYNRILRVSPESFEAPERDRYIQSKGHSVEALYVVLADRGFFPEADLETLCQYGSHYVGHPTRKVRGIEQNTGALGHGLSICTGIALAGKMDGADYRVYTLLGDGELTEGSNWEATLAAAHYGPDNVVRAGLESISYQLRDVLDMMREDADVELDVIHGDGGATTNGFLMQFTADVVGLELKVSDIAECSPLGAAMAGALGMGIYGSLKELVGLPREFSSYRPEMEKEKVEKYYDGWKKAVERVL